MRTIVALLVTFALVVLCWSAAGAACNTVPDTRLLNVASDSPLRNVQADPGVAKTIDYDCFVRNVDDTSCSCRRFFTTAVAAGTGLGYDIDEHDITLCPGEQRRIPCCAMVRPETPVNQYRFLWMVDDRRAILEDGDDPNQGRDEAIVTVGRLVCEVTDPRKALFGWLRRR